MRVHSFLVRGDGHGAPLVSQLGSVSSMALNALVLMSLGADYSALLSAVASSKIDCPVYLTETYGIIGFDEASQAHVELMEKGRGSEYGFQGGSGGQGCVIIAFEGARAGHTSDFPKDASSLMVIADTSKAFAKVASSAPLHYGGITKECYLAVNPAAGSPSLERVPFFWVASPTGSAPVGVSTFTEGPSHAASALLGKLPAGWQPGAIGLFPCFTRGVNLYKEEDVESSAIAEAASLPVDARIFGMFAHGELGPSSFSGFTREASEAAGILHEQHSMTSILAVHTREAPGAKDEI